MSSQGTESSQGIDQQAEQQKQFAEVFAYLPEQDIEQFYAHYQLWLMRRRVPIIEKQLELLHEYLNENQQLVESLRPSAVALAVLVRLQSSGVTNIDVLDQMLERGEDWLDRMMQRLDYCEQVEDFIQGDYTQWCIRSLEGAYDWIDTVLGLGATTAETDVSYTNAPDVDALEATEELLLQKLRLDDEESALETTLSQPISTNEDERELAALEANEKSTAEQPATTSEASEVHIPQPQPAAYDVMEVGIAEEFLLARESTTETPERAVKGPETLELEDWENLESAEARPEPWYSVNLAADAAPDAQPDMMRDWVNILQAFDAPQAESSAPEAAQVAAEANSMLDEDNEPEIAQVSEGAPVMPIELPAAEDASQIENVELVAEEASEEEEVVRVDEGEHVEVETPHLAEAQSEPEMCAEGEVTLVAEEAPSDTEISVEDEAMLVVEEVQHEVETSVEGEVAAAIVEESSREPENIAVEAEEAAQEVEEHASEETPVLEESEPVTEPAEEPSPAPAVEEAEVASSDDVEEVELPDVESEASESVEEVVAESESVTEISEETSITSLAEAEAVEVSSSVDVAAPLARAAVPGEEEETAPVEHATIPDEIEETASVEIAAISHQAEVEEITSLEQAVVPDETEETDEEAAAPLVRITNPLEVDDTVSWSYVPFEETESSEESGNARPWYEYLERDEQVAQMPQSWSGIEQPGAVQDAFSAEFVQQTPELPEAVSFEQHEVIEEGLPESPADLQSSGGSTQSELVDTGNEPGVSATLPATPALQEELERLERERSANQEPHPEIDATQPMEALKGRQRKKGFPVEPVVPVGEVTEKSRTVAEPDEPEVRVSEAQEKSGMIAATRESSEAPVTDQGTAFSGDVSEMPTALIRNEMRSIQDEMRSIQDKVRSIQQNISEIPATPVLREAGEVPVPQPQQEIPTAQQQDMVNEAAPPDEGAKPSARDAAPVERVVQPPEKIGFWRRLFGRKRKK